MTTDENAVLFGFNPARDITVTNTHDYPIKITMWTEGSGPGMEIHTVIYELIPNSHRTNSTNSTNGTNATV